MTAADTALIAGTTARRALSLRVQPGLLIAWLLVAVVIAWAIVPWLFTGYSGTVGVPRDKLLPRARSTGSARMSSAATSTRASSTARSTRSPARSSP